MRVRRKRKGDSIVADVAEGAGETVVAEMGCCLFEVVASVSVLVGILFVPVYLWMA